MYDLGTRIIEVWKQLSLILCFCGPFYFVVNWLDFLSMKLCDLIFKKVLYNVDIEKQKQEKLRWRNQLKEFENKNTNKE